MTDQPNVRPLAADAPESPDPTVGLLLADRYRIGALVARGGMARVYRATDDRLAGAAAGVSHPNLVHVYDSGSDRALHFIVMELLEGYRSLRERLATGGPLAVEETLDLGSQLLEGLEAVHERGLVHCDVKAGNLLLGPGPLKLIDFGIARVRDSGAGEGISIGSLGYMSPEQLRNEPLSPASDLFAVGVVLYEALTGELPFHGSDPDEMAAAHRAGASRAPSQLHQGVPPRLDDAILQALRPDPEQRFSSAGAMRRALQTVATRPVAEETTQVHAVARAETATGPRHHALPGRSRSPARRRRPLGWLAPVVILVAAAIVALLVIVPLLELGARNGTGPPATTAGPTDTPVPIANRVTVPDTVGLSKDAAIKAASGARLTWTIECNQDPAKPKGIIGQDPAAGTVVAAGSPFTMSSARIADCR